jgi:hypothetical protein
MMEISSDLFSGLDGVNQLEAIASLEPQGPRQEAHLFYSRSGQLTNNDHY